MHQIKGQKMVYGRDEEIDLEKIHPVALKYGLSAIMGCLKHDQQTGNISFNRAHCSSGTQFKYGDGSRPYVQQQLLDVRNLCSMMHRLCIIEILSSNSDDKKQVLD